MSNLDHQAWIPGDAIATDTLQSDNPILALEAASIANDYIEQMCNVAHAEKQLLDYQHQTGGQCSVSYQQCMELSGRNAWDADQAWLRILRDQGAPVLDDGYGLSLKPGYAITTEPDNVTGNIYVIWFKC